MDEVFERFENVGGNFLTERSTFLKKLKNIRAFFFDWDGVFTRGEKNALAQNDFNEPDSLGLNMLRFGKWLETGLLQPFVIVTGSDKNPTADFFTKREHFHSIYKNCMNKRVALEHFLEENKLQASEVCFVFDDVLDLSLAKKVGLRACIKRNSSPEFERYIAENQLCDYITGNTSGNSPLREVSELFLGLLGLFDTSLDKRTAFEGDFSTYTTERNSLVPQFLSVQENTIIVKGKNK